MVNSFSDGKGRLVEPPYGAYVDSWQLPMNSNFGLTDALISGTTTLNTSSLTPSTPFWTLVFQDFDTNQTPWQNPLAGQNMRILVKGPLTYNATVFIPQNFPGMWIIDNQTTGAFTVTVKTTNASSVGVNPEQGYMSTVFCDGVNVRYSDIGAIIDAIQNMVSPIPAGSILPFGGTTAPAGYLPCDGAAVSRTTYINLFNAIGTTWGAGDGALTFNVPNLTNMFLRGAGASPVGTYEADTYLNHDHPVTDPGHTHNVPQSQRGAFGGSNPIPSGLTGTTYPNQLTAENATTGVTVGNSTTGGTETRPVNKRVLYVIRT